MMQIIFIHMSLCLIVVHDDLTNIAKGYFLASEELYNSPC